jgi:peroxiredoxin
VTEARKPKTDRLTAFIVAVLLLGTIFMGWQEVQEGRMLAVGSEAPDFTLERPRGEPVQRSALAGKVVVVNFWATWCPPCREEMPDLVKVVQEFEAKGVTLVAISNDDLDTQKEVVPSFIRAFPELAPYAAYGTPPVSASYLVRALPTTYVLDRKGRVVVAWQGQANEVQLNRWVQDALAVAE